MKKTADNKRTFVQFVFAYWQVVVVISGPELNMGSLTPGEDGADNECRQRGVSFHATDLCENLCEIFCCFYSA